MIKWWERFLWGGMISKSTNEDGAVGGVVTRNRRATDAITEDMIQQKANNGRSTKELIAEFSLENKVEHAEMKTMLGFHNKFVWTCIGILVTGFVGGLIALGYWAIRILLGG